jgi:hypothetical protein
MDMFYYNDIHKLRACHIMMKEDPPVFVDPFSSPPDQNRNAHAGTLDCYSGYSFVPIYLMEKYMEEKIGRGHAYGHEGPQPDPTVCK